MCQACKAITALILASATSAGAVADFVIKHAEATAQKGEPAKPTRGEHHD